MSEKRDIRMIACDLDGTLLNSKHQMTKRTELALRKAMARGIQVVLATGKTRASAVSLIEHLGLKTPGVFVQGLQVYNADGTLRYQETMPVDLARRVITYAEMRGFGVIAYSGNRLLVRAKDSRFDFLAAYHEPPLEPIGNLVNHLDTLSINKLIVVGSEPAAVRNMRWQLEQQHNGKLTITMSAVSINVEILPFGASKGKAVMAVARDLAIAPEHIMAIGDGENDVEMLQYVGWGVAVANASPKLKQVAQAIVADHDHDGVAEAVERFALPPEPKPEPRVEAASAEDTSDVPLAPDVPLSED